MADDEAPVRQKTSYHHGDLRGQLLEAVRLLVERDGPDGFSVSEACRLAGVSTAAPYKHFRDRGEILRGVVELGLERLRARMAAGAEAEPPGSLARVTATGQAYIDFAREEPGLFRTVFGLTADHDADPALVACGAATFGVLVGAVAERLRLPPDAPEVRRRAYLLWCFVHGYAFLVIDRKIAAGDIDLPEDRILALVGRGMLGADLDADMGADLGGGGEEGDDGG